MRVRPGLAVVLCVAVLCAVPGCGGSHERAGVVRAVRAPLGAFIARDVSALCSSLTPGVASHLLAGEPNCRSGSRAIFDSLRHSIEFYGPGERPGELKISAITGKGDLRQVTTTWPWPNIHRTAHVSLERSDGKWLISSPTRLVKFITCFRTAEVPCLISYGIEFGPGPSTVRLPPPAEPSRKRQRIEAGSTVPHASAHYELAFSPPISGGSLGWCVDYRTSNESSSACPQRTSAVSPVLEPSWGSSAPPPVTQGFVLTTSEVAAVSVNGSPGIPMHVDAAIPDGLRAVLVEFASPGGGLRGQLPQVVALDGKGNPLERSEPSFRYPGYGLEGVFWQHPSRPPPGACELNANQLPGLTPEWGHVVPKIHSLTGLLPPALLSCVDTEFYLDNWPLEVAVVLNAAHPGARPEQLHDFKPVPGHSGLFENVGWTGQVARLIPGAWIVVEGGSDLQQRLTVLEHLRASIHL